MSYLDKVRKLKKLKEQLKSNHSDKLVESIINLDFEIKNILKQTDERN